MVCVEKILKDSILKSLKTKNEDLSFKITVSVPIGKVKFNFCSNILFSLKGKVDEGLFLDNFLKSPYIKTAEIIKGYVNFNMSELYFYESVKNFSLESINIGKGERVNVEYCSVNPTGFLHVGHARNAILGDAIANVLSKSGFSVAKEYYVNDAGNQINLLAESVKSRYEELKGNPTVFPEGGYLGAEIKEIAKLVGPKDSLEEIGKKSIAFFIENIKKDLLKAGVQHDSWVFESNVIENGYIEKAIKLLKSKDLLYEGQREGKQVEKGENSGETLLLLKTTEFGDDADRPLRKGDGSWTYLAPDIGYHLYKIERGFSNLICVLGADHDSYAKRIKIAVKALKNDIKHETPVCQMVTFNSDGKNVKFSKRKGNSIRLSELLDEVSKDIVRFMILSKKPGTPFIFDFGKAVEVSMQNPVFYVQYACARAHSVLRNYGKSNCEIYENCEALSYSEYQNLIVLCKEWPSVLAESVKTLSVHNIVNYLIKLAEKFHFLWQAGKTDANKKFILENNSKESSARMAIINVFIVVIKDALNTLGIQALEKMD